MAGSLKNIGLTSLDDLFKTDEQRQADAQERVQIVPADQVFPYARQPYSIDRPTQDLAQLMDSIERVGIAEPLIVRPRDGGGYEIIAGHRRDYCAKTIGLETRPVIVREYSDEDADILVVDYNIHRDDLLPSEKARAYKLRLNAMKRQGKRLDLTSTQVGPKFVGTRSNEDLAQQANESKTQIQRYLDFPYEIEKRYQKMCREDPDYADLIYYYLVENGTDLRRSMTSEEFHDHIQTQYDNVMDGVY